MLAVASPERLYEIEETRRTVRFEIAGLPLAEAYVIRSLYGIGCEGITKEELAARLETSPDAISELERSGKARLFIALRNFER